ncbi:hypothetical protein Tco_0025904 [Tanacetum coccineum]
MNPQETQQNVAHDEKWVPSDERVKISSTNIRLETTMPQKEETFQVVIDIIKNSTCFKAFSISADIPEIFMQQFWYTIKKVQDTDSYKFLLDNKKCTVNAEVFRIILDICPRVEGVDFMDVPDDEIALTFLIDLGYKGPLNRHTNMFVDHMHQPWRTLAAIINKCLSRKMASNDKLRKSRIDILWGMFNRENVYYPALIWEDIAYQIDHMKEKRSRRENMPYPRFTKIIINHILKQHTPLTNLNQKHYHTIKDDDIVSKLKFVIIGEDYHEYGLTILDIPPKKSRGKGSKGRKTVNDSQETVDVSKESEPEPEPVKKKTVGRRVVKKKVTLSTDDNIISDDPDAALELAKSISKTKAEEAKAASKVHDTHARIVTESAKKKFSDRSSRSVAIQDTRSAPKSTPTTSKLKLKVSTTSSEGTGAKPWVLDEEKDITKKKVILEWEHEQDSEFSDDDNNDNDDKDGDDDDKDDDHYKIRVRKNEDEEMENAEVEESDKGDKEVTDVAKEDPENTLEVKDDPKKTELPPTSSSLFVSSGFGDQFLKLSSDSSLVSTVKDSVDTNFLQPISTDAPTITTAVSGSNALIDVQLRVAKLEQDVSELKIVDHSTEALVVLKFQVPAVVDSYLDSKVGDVFQKALQKHMTDLIYKYSLQQLPELTKKPTPTVDLEQESEKTLKEYDLKSSLYQTMHANKSFNRNLANHKLYHALMEALIEDENAMDKGVADTVKDHKRKHDDNDDDDDEGPSAGPNQGKTIKRRRTKEFESAKKPSTTKETHKGKPPTKGSKTNKFTSAKKPVDEPIAKVVMDDAGDDVVRDDDQLQAASATKMAKTPNLEWFKQPLRPLTPDSEWNKRQYVLNGIKIENLTQDISLDLPSIYKLDWNNPEGDRYPFNLSKPLPLQGPSGHRTVPADYFFNNDLEYLKTFDPEFSPRPTVYRVNLAFSIRIRVGSS